MPDILFAAGLQSSVERCLLCGQKKPLTFEHIPPKSCYNSMQRQFYDWDALLQQHKGPRIYKRGLGKKVLCNSCNQIAGDHYVPPFRDFISQLANLAVTVAPNQYALGSLTFRPGAVAKQLAHIACSMSLETSIGQRDFDRLRLIAMDPHSVNQPCGTKIYLYLTADGVPRLSGMASLPSMGEIVLVYSEVALAPIGIVIMKDDESTVSVASKLGLYDTTAFNAYDISEVRSMHFWLRRLTPIGPGPLDYQGINVNIQSLR